MFNDLSLSSNLQMRHGLSKKERKDGMPKKHDPKKMDTSMSMKKEREEKKDTYIAMSSCYPNKGERDS